MSINRPDVSIISLNGKTPQIHDSAFIAPGCRIIGDVIIGEDVSVWYNCVLRGDGSRIEVGRGTNIQDGSIVHCDPEAPGVHPEFPTVIGEGVVIGHMSIVHGCTIENFASIGMGATIMNGCKVESDAMLGAGALLPGGKHIPEKQLWVGRPAKHMRDFSEDEIKRNRTIPDKYVVNSKRHQKALEALR